MTGREKYDIKENAGDNNEEEIPVPMPNTEVKLLSAEDTYELPCWENRKLPVFYIYIKITWKIFKKFIRYKRMEGIHT